MRWRRWPRRDSPQYIDFTSPLLVALFSKMPGALVHFTIELQERYPDAARLPMANGERYASELVLQFDSLARDIERPVILTAAKDLHVVVEGAAPAKAGTRSLRSG